MADRPLLDLQIIPTDVTSTYLCPEDPFPDVESLPLVEVQSLHSRVCRQVDREYLSALDGPSVETLDRQQELVQELDRREGLRAGQGRR